MVTGATGFLGRHLLTTLHAASESFRALALVRDVDTWNSYNWTRSLHQVETLRGSVTETASWTSDERLNGLSGIFHLAAVVRHSRANSAEIYRTNVDGTLNMVRLAADHDCRMIFVSTTGTVACFRSQDSKADENSPFCESEVSSWPYYHSKIQAERRAMQLAKELGVQLIIIRPPALLGPGDHRFRSTSNILRFLQGKLPFLIRGGIHFADVRDATKALLRAMILTEVPRPVYHLTGTACSIETFFKMVEEASGVRSPRWILPFRPAWLAAAVLHRLGILLNGSLLKALPDPVVIEMASRYWDAKSLFAERQLGYVSRDALKTIADTVDWLRKNHESLSL
ncbi:MAG: NAD-dependent epimerase/dehydratase family protein [Candidatus Marinimicrobia bacterium]|nr:NAD-dependent epimerase/dehydratase family protein [Candidatus Neomarinimicrobiota bacterium]